MAEEQLLERVRREIRERLDETESLIRERERLQQALNALDALPEAVPARQGARRPRPRRAPAGRRAPRGQRRDELLQLVKGSPDLSVSEAARQIGISPSQAFTLVRRLEEEGVLRREDGRLVFVAPAASRARAREEPLAGVDAAAGSVPPDEGAGLGSAEGSAAHATPAVAEAPSFGDERPRGSSVADEDATAPQHEGATATPDAPRAE